MAELKSLIVNGSARVNGPLYADNINPPLIEITYSELKSLRNSSQLVPGQQYRITDYNTTVNFYIEVGSPRLYTVGNHQFDVIVTADDETHLNENARAIRHKGDTYFPGTTKFEAWELKYCLDNDGLRFDWALLHGAGDITGKGVIYYMKDEFNNECPYDFKNIMFYRKWNTDTQLWSDIPNSGTITGFIPCYTFSSEGTSSTTSFTDMSLSDTNDVYSNVIHSCGMIASLNNNCFFGSNCYSNTFGSNCYNNTFGPNCSTNTFGHNCSTNTFVTCYGNMFGDRFYSNNCNSCNYNIFKLDNAQHILKNSNYNNFGCGNRGNELTRCNNNTFEGNNAWNKLTECNYNTFENHCVLCNMSYCTHNKFNVYTQNFSGSGCTLSNCIVLGKNYSGKVWHSGVSLSSPLSFKIISLNSYNNMDYASFEKIVELD